MRALLPTRETGYVAVDDAQRSRTRGLIIHRSLSGSPGAWTVTHLDSGLAVAAFDKLPSARRFAMEIGLLADWTRPKSELTKKTVDTKRLFQIRDAIQEPAS